MNKTTFYTLQLDEKRKPIARKVNGYHFGKNTLSVYTNYGVDIAYYRNASTKTWHAIDLATGLSIAMGSTQKEVIRNSYAPELKEKVKNVLGTAYYERSKSAYTDLVKKAKENEQ